MADTIEDCDVLSDPQRDLLWTQFKDALCRPLDVSSRFEETAQGLFTGPSDDERLCRNAAAVFRGFALLSEVTQSHIVPPVMQMVEGMAIFCSKTCMS